MRAGLLMPVFYLFLFHVQEGQGFGRVLAEQLLVQKGKQAAIFKGDLCDNQGVDVQLVG